MRTARGLRLAMGGFLVATVSACGAAGGGGAAPVLRIGALFPLGGSLAADAHDEYLGAQIAAGMVDGAGGVDGRQIQFDLRDLESGDQAPALAASLHGDGVPAVIGAYSSALSIPAAAAVARQGMVYWETGAVADQVTGQAQPLVFRVGANGSDLGGNSGRFVLQQIAPRLQRAAATLRAYLVTADDAYAHSVADAARAALTAGGATVVGESVYDPFLPDWTPAVSAIRAARPDILLLSSHIPDGIAFRRAFLAAGLHVDAFMGTTMAQCLPDFGDALGADAVGVFASDRPDDSFNPAGLDAEAQALYERFSQVWQQRTGRAPSEEGIAGFSSAWALFHDVLPRAAALDARGIAAAARTVDLPAGSLPDGGGLLFDTSGPQMGQNTRAAAVIWQWQGVRHSVVVWPPAYATGSVTMVPLPR
ncbi:MAG TPA: ABC transporter substrate-binding protein [Candidatus Dormibacteraeota bacterium]|nr:ABC transporter substrate-binding protein [Candidatus Dormibacteraeota bacterium]